MAPSDYARLDDESLVALIFTEGDRLPSAWAAEAVSRGQRLVPLLAKTTADREAWERFDVGGWAVVHACYILGAIGGDEAAQALLKAFDNAAEVDNDWTFEDWQAIFGRLGPSVLDGLRERVEEGTADEFWTDAALSGMAAVASRHPELQEEVFSDIAAFASDLTRTESSRALAGSTLLDFRQTKHTDILKNLAELEDNDVFFPETVDAELAEAEPDLKRYQRDWMEFYKPDEIARRQERWDFERFSEVEAWYAAVNEAAEDLDAQPQPSRAEAEKRLGDLLGLAKRTLSLMTDDLWDLDDRQVLEHHALAMELYGAVRQDPARWRLFEAAMDDATLPDWLMGLPLELEKRGRVDEEASLGLAWANIRLPEIFLSDRALILARAGRAQQAREQVGLVRKLFGHDYWIDVKAGMTYAHLADWAQAEDVFRSARRRAPYDTEREHATRLLINVLQKSGKTGEAQALRSEEEALAREREAERAARLSYAEPIVREGPKIGRNDPCPCASGKKHKKCCLGK